MNIQAKSGRKTHAGTALYSVGPTDFQSVFYKPACNQTSTGWHKEPRADEVTCRKCLRKIAKGIQNEISFNQA